MVFSRRILESSLEWAGTLMHLAIQAPMPDYLPILDSKHNFSPDLIEQIKKKE
jgi:hypothetical protein